MKQNLLLLMALGIMIVVMASFTNGLPQDAQLKASIERGSDIYVSNCITCHMENGEGIPSAFPPLAKSDYLMDKTDESIKTILNGASGEMVVNGTTYYGAMAAIDLSDQEVADVMNYIRNSWGNSGEIISPAQVAKLRD